MKTMTLLRYATLAALLAGALPAPASAQFGGLKRKLKEKIIQAAASDAAKKLAGGDSAAAAAAPGTTSGTAAPTGAPRARKGTAATPAGPVFNDVLLEITPDVLDRLERALTAEIAAKKAGEAAEKNAVVDRDRQFKAKIAYDECKQQVEHSPEARKAYEEYMANLQSANAPKALEILTKRAEQITRARCGPDPGQTPAPAPLDKGGQYKKALGAGVNAFGLGERQYALVKERVHPYCVWANQATDIGYVYAPREVETMKARCEKLLPLLKDAI